MNFNEVDVQNGHVQIIGNVVVLHPAETISYSLEFEVVLDEEKKFRKLE